MWGMGRTIQASFPVPIRILHEFNWPVKPHRAKDFAWHYLLSSHALTQPRRGVGVGLAPTPLGIGCGKHDYRKPSREASAGPPGPRFSTAGTLPYPYALTPANPTTSLSLGGYVVISIS